VVSLLNVPWLGFGPSAKRFFTPILPAQRADLIRAVYERIVVAGPTFVGARLTPAASQHGLALALPQVVRARPTGVGRAITTCTIPIEGRDEWLEAARAAERPA
jgi:hypothetical protein